MNSRVRARLFLGILLLLANGYALLVLYTYLLGTATTATVERCVNGRHSDTCYGRWVDSAGEPDDGEIADVGSLSPRQVPIRLGPLGAYADDGWGLWLRVGIVFVVDGAMVFGLSKVARLKRTMRHDVTALSAPGAALLLHADSGVARTPDGAVLLTPGQQPDLVLGANGAPAFRIDRTDSGFGEPGVGVFTPDGRPIGVVARGHVGYWVIFRMLAGNTEILRARATAGALVLDLPTGRRAGGIGWVRGSEWVLRLEIPLSEPARTLAIVLLLEIHRLTAIRANSRSSAALGQGWAE